MELVQRTVSFLTFDFDIQQLWVNTEGKVAWQCPWCGRPGNQSHFLIFNQLEAYHDRWVLNFLETKMKQKEKSIQYLDPKSTILIIVLHKTIQGVRGL